MSLQRKSDNIGDVRDSVLTEAQFQSLNGAGWVLWDGRDITGSALATITGLTVLSDARGLVRRSKNNGRSDSLADPGGERAVGTTQTHATAKNGLYDAGHAHGYNQSVNVRGFADYASGGYSPPTTGSTTSPGNANIQSSDPETRMNNIAVNTFIKIN